MRASQPGDIIAFDAPYGRIPLEYYVHELWAEARAPSPAFPIAPWGQLPLLSPELSVDTRDWLRRNPPSRPSRLWLVASHQRDASRGGKKTTLLLLDRRRYCSVQTRTFQGIGVQLYDASGCAGRTEQWPGSPVPSRVSLAGW